jgi:hypothetical protein
MKSIRYLVLASAMAATAAAGCDDDDTKPSPLPRDSGTIDTRPADAGDAGDAQPGEAGSEAGGDVPPAETGGEVGPDVGPDTTGPDTGDALTPDTQADTPPSPFQPTLFLDLPATCNTPDGMRLDTRNGNIILSCPNFFGKVPNMPNDYLAPPVLMKITPANALEMYYATLPAPPGAPGRAGPMGIDFGPDGHLYIADHQYRYDSNYKSRILRVNTDTNGAPTGSDVLVDGLRLANAVMWNKDYLYVSDTWAYDGTDMGKSAIYRFTRAELAAANSGAIIHIQKPTSTTTDPHLFHTFTTEANRGLNLAGADGITFDAAGNLITGRFGDGVVTKIVINTDGSKGAVTEWVKDPKLTCVDGIFFHAPSGNIYVADSQKNAIQVISAAGAVTTLWENDNTTGVGGLLDQPAEPIIRGKDLIIANFDAGFGAPAAGFQPGKNTAFDAPYTLSLIRLP